MKSNNTNASFSQSAPKKYIRINGLTKLNPEYQKWKDAQENRQATATTTIAEAHAVADQDPDVVVEVEAFGVSPTPITNTNTASASKDDDVPFQDDLDEDLPTANARPVPPRRPQPYLGVAVGSGEDLLRRMKQHRKVATVNSGLWGGLLGMLLLGPVGAVGVGYGSALITKHSLKRREKLIRKRLEGRLQDPVYVR